MIRIGFEKGTAEAVNVNITHTVVAGITRSGKSETVKALISRAEDSRFLIFDVKRPRDYGGVGTEIPIFVEEKTDPLMLKRLLESQSHLALKFEFPELIKVCKKEDTFEGILNAVNEGLQSKVHPIVENKLLVLQHLLSKLVDELERTPISDELELKDRINVMDLNGVSLELQQLAVHSTLKRILERESNLIVVLDEAHRFIPQSGSNASKETVTTFIKEGGAKGLWLWLVDQTITGIDKQVLKQCVAPDTRIYLNDKIMTIRDLENKWRQVQVTTTDVKNIKRKPIIDYIKKRRSVPTLKLETRDGHQIVATEDHEFYTPEGWKPLRELKSGDMVAFLPEKDELPDENTTNELDLIKSRLVGYLFADGCLSPPNKYRTYYVAFYGNKEDLEKIRDDLIKLGVVFTPKSLEYCENTVITNDKKYGKRKTVHRAWRLKLTKKKYWMLFKSLGVPVGRKTTQPISVPEWIMNGNLSIKCAFLSGYCSGEGHKICFVSKSAPTFRISFTTCRDILDHGLKFARQLKSLFEDLSIHVRKIETYPNRTIAKDGRERIGISLHFNNDERNIVQFLRRVGYVYCRYKEGRGRLAQAFLEEKIYFEDRIAKAIEVAYRIVVDDENLTDMLRAILPRDRSRNALKSQALKRRFPTFNKWVKRYAINEDGLIWREVKSITPYMIDDVRDLTIPDTHCYFANGFLVHNCWIWILGKQRELNEAKRTVAQIPFKTGINEKSIMRLKVGEFVVCTEEGAKIAYVQPSWLSEEYARNVALGKVSVKDVMEVEEDLVWKERCLELEEKVKALREQNEEMRKATAEYQLRDVKTEKALKAENNFLRNRIKQLESEVKRLREDLKSADLLKQQKDEEIENLRKELEGFRELKEALAKIIPVPRVQVPVGSKSTGPSEISVSTEQPVIHVKVERKLLHLTDRDLHGKIAIVYSEGALGEGWFSVSDVVKAFQRHAWKRDPRIGPALDDFTRWGYFEKKYAGRKPIYHVLIKPEEAKSKGVLKVDLSTR